MSITVANNFGPVTTVKGIQPVHHSVVMGEGASLFSAALLDKLKPANNTGLGSSSVQGSLVYTRASERSFLEVVNSYLRNNLTADELTLILNHREKFDFSMGVGDRRDDFKERFSLVTNWRGEDVQNFLLAPDPWDEPHYNFRLTFSAGTGTIIFTDSHAGENMYGSMRYFTIRLRV
ncbi:hypothetical protein G0S15_001401 [Salmonella enterica]|nr:hypothetical protein [Salmonella enterica]